MQNLDRITEPVTVYGRLAAFVMGRRKMTFGVLALSLLVSMVCAAQLRIDTNLLSLMPPEEPFIQALHQLERPSDAIWIWNLSSLVAI